MDQSGGATRTTEFRNDDRNVPVCSATSVIQSVSVFQTELYQLRHNTILLSNNCRIVFLRLWSKQGFPPPSWWTLEWEMTVVQQTGCQPPRVLEKLRVFRVAAALGAPATAPARLSNAPSRSASVPGRQSHPSYSALFIIQRLSWSQKLGFPKQNCFSACKWKKAPCPEWEPFTFVKKWNSISCCSPPFLLYLFFILFPFLCFLLFAWQEFSDEKH